MRCYEFLCQHRFFRMTVRDEDDRDRKLLLHFFIHTYVLKTKVRSIGTMSSVSGKLIHESLIIKLTSIIRTNILDTGHYTVLSHV